MTNFTLETASNLSVIELRKIAHDRFPGRTSDIRKLKKNMLVEMIVENMDLDSALETFEIASDEPTRVSGSDASIIEAIRRSLGSMSPDEDAVRRIVREEIETKTTKTVDLVVRRENGSTKNVGRQHREFETLLASIAAGVNVLLVGPAGSGKTTAVSKVADAIGADFYSLSVGPQTSKVDLLGYMDATGEYVTSNIRRAFENGGVLLIDELDAGNPAVLTTLNSIIENDSAGFPDGQIKRHEDFVVVASANTYGRGANRQFVGRQQLDDATLDRFVTLDWDYDEAFENDLPGIDPKWTAHVQNLRRIADNLRVRHTISPRASLNGSKLLRGGLSWKRVEEMVIWKGLDATTRKSIEANV